MAEVIIEDRIVTYGGEVIGCIADSEKWGISFLPERGPSGEIAGREGVLIPLLKLIKKERKQHVKRQGSHRKT